MKNPVVGTLLLKKRRLLRKRSGEISNRIRHIYGTIESEDTGRQILQLFQQVQECIDMFDQLELEYSGMCEVLRNIVLREQRHIKILDEALRPISAELLKTAGSEGYSRLHTVFSHLEEAEEAVQAVNVLNTPLTDKMRSELPRRAELFKQYIESLRVK